MVKDGVVEREKKLTMVLKYHFEELLMTFHH